MLQWFFSISTILNSFETCFYALEKTNGNRTDNTCTTFFNIFVIFLKFSFIMFFFWHCHSIMNFNFLILALSNFTNLNTATKLRYKDGEEQADGMSMCRLHGIYTWQSQMLQWNCPHCDHALGRVPRVWQLLTL